MDRLIRRVAVLVEIASRRRESSTRNGKTAMQKLVYLLQECFEVDLGYRFQLYTYGPYDAGVMHDIDYASAIGVLKLSYDDDLGYQIEPGPQTNDLESERCLVKKELMGKLDRLMERFGALSARELELQATLVYVNREEPGIVDDALLERIKGLKPKYQAEEIEGALNKLQDAGLLYREGSGPQSDSPKR